MNKEKGPRMDIEKATVNLFTAFGVVIGKSIGAAYGMLRYVIVGPQQQK